MGKRNIANILDSVIIVLSTLSIVALLYLILNEYVNDGQFVIWLYPSVGGNGWNGTLAIQTFPLITVGVLVLVTQIYLNYRLIQILPRRKDNKN